MGEEIVTYYNLEPRLSARVKLTESASIKAGYSRNNQYIHLITNSGSTLPTDLWVPSSRIVRPQIGDQYSLGFFKNFKDNMYEASVFFEKELGRFEWLDWLYDFENGPLVSRP